MEGDDNYEEECTLQQIVTTQQLPQRAKVTQGYDDPDNPDNEFATNDVIIVRSCK
jgi:hypothetical protein